MIKIGKCYLCDQDKELINAHIIPRAFYRDLRDNQENLYMINSEEGKKIPRPIGECDNSILCYRCDNEILGVFDKYAIEFFRHDSHGQNIVQRDAINNYGYYEIHDYEYKKLKLFFISVLWRAGISSRNPFQEVDLGLKHQNKLKQMLNDSDAGQPQDYPVTMVYLEANKKFPDFERQFWMPIRSRLNGVNYYKMTFGRFEFYIKCDNRIDKSAINTLSLSAKPSLTIPVIPFGEERHLKAFELLRKAIHKRKRLS